jgi:hypothetical protein
LEQIFFLLSFQAFNSGHSPRKKRRLPTHKYPDNQFQPDSGYERPVNVLRSTVPLDALAAVHETHTHLFEGRTSSVVRKVHLYLMKNPAYKIKWWNGSGG